MCLTISEPSQKKRRMSIKEGNGIVKKEIGANLIIHDKQNRCLLKDGDYDCLIEEISGESPNLATGKSCSWERLKVLIHLSLLFFNHIAFLLLIL